MANRIKCKFDKSVCGTYLGTIVESGLKKGRFTIAYSRIVPIHKT